MRAGPEEASPAHLTRPLPSSHLYLRFRLLHLGFFLLIPLVTLETKWTVSWAPHSP